MSQNNGRSNIFSLLIGPIATFLLNEGSAAIDKHRAKRANNSNASFDKLWEVIMELLYGELKPNPQFHLLYRLNWRTRSLA